MAAHTKERPTKLTKIPLPYPPTSPELAAVTGRDSQALRKNEELVRLYRNGNVLFYEPESVEVFLRNRGMQPVWLDRITGKPIDMGLLAG